MGICVEKGRRWEQKREQAVDALVQSARDAIDAFRASYKAGVTVDAEFHRTLQRLHVACEAVEFFEQ